MTAASDQATHLLQIGRHAEALRVLSEDSETPRDSDALVTMARCHYRLENNQKALESANASLAIDPDHTGGWIMRALILLDMDQPWEALPAARKAVELSSWHSGSHSTLGRALIALGMFDEALVSVENVKELAPDDPSGWSLLTRLHLAQQRYGEAEMSARAALAIDPADDEAKILLGAAQAQGRGSAGRVVAMDTLVSSLRENPDQEHVRKFLVELAWGGGPSVPVRVVIVILAIATGGGGAILVLLMWTVWAVHRWSTVPKDVKKLVMADPKSKRKVIAVGAALAMVWAAILIAIVVIAIGKI